MASSTKRPLVFLGVGVFNTSFDFAFYSLLTSFVLRDKSQIALAGIVSGTVALLCAFATHSLITWRGSHISHRTIIKFIAFTGFGMWLIRPLLLAGFIRWSGLYAWVYKITHTLQLPFSQSFIAKTGAFGFMAIILLIYNYFTYNRFVFTKRNTQSAETTEA